MNLKNIVVWKSEMLSGAPLDAVTYLVTVNNFIYITVVGDMDESYYSMTWGVEQLKY